MIDEREEQAREREDLEFQRERAIAELELLKKQVEKSQTGKLLGQLEQVSEEKKEMMQHFVIQLDSQSAEISRLKEQISVFDPNWKDEHQSPIQSSPAAKTQPSS